jgi:alkylation response protein AidB-like acyl-CoA dehydrogenase
MQYQLTDEQLTLRKSVREFATRYLAPICEKTERAGAWMPDEVIDLLRTHDLVGVDVPEEYGGLGLDLISCCIVAEELSRVWFSASTYATPMVTGPIIASGTPEQRAAFLPKLASGEWIGAFALTESAAGSDAARLELRAERDGNDYVLNGNKIFITNAHRAHVFLVFARTAPAGDVGGVTIFIVERDTPGLRIGQQFETLAHGANPIWEVLFENCRVSTNRILGAEHRGFEYVKGGFAKTRALYAARCLGTARGALEYSLGYVRERSQFGKELISFQATRFKLADMATALEASRHLIYRAATLVDTGDKDAVAVASMAKLMASQSAFKVCTEAVQLLGGHGYTKDHPVERYFRESKLFQIGEGTDEMQRLVIARHIARNGV